MVSMAIHSGFENVGMATKLLKSQLYLSWTTKLKPTHRPFMFLLHIQINLQIQKYLRKH